MSEGGAGGGSGVHPASGDRRSDDGSESVVREDPAVDDLWEWERGDLIREVRRLRSLVVEHHSITFLDGPHFVGDRCAVCLADGASAEAEDQHQSSGDDRQHHVLKGEIHVVTPPGR